MFKRIIAILLTGALMMTIIGCGKQGPKPVYSAKQAEKEYKYTASDKKVEENMEPQTLREGVNGFAYALFDEMNRDENIIFSPYSLCSALSMLNIGAGSDTKEELDKLLGIRDTDTFRELMREYLLQKWSKDTYVLTANSVWMDENKEWAENIEEDFLQPAGYFYQSELYKEDFHGNPDGVVKAANSWADVHTKGMIPSIISKLPADAVMLLMNAVYFQGKWNIPFPEFNTKDTTFHGINGDETIPMMALYGEDMPYMVNEKWKGISVQYKGEPVTMKLFMPLSEEEDAGTLYASMTYEEREAMLNALGSENKKHIGCLKMPKFEIEQEIVKLDDILQKMGMKSAYRDDADFDKIAEDISVATVIHKAKIIVDEEGTKAAAVTAIMTKETTAMEIESFDFIADRPFIYVIQDTDTGMILFMGLMNGQNIL